MKQSAPLGILLSLLAYFCVACMGTAEKMLGPAMPVIVTVFIQNTICLLAVSLLLLHQSRRKFNTQFIESLKTEHPYLHFIRSVSGVGCFYLLFFIIGKMPLSQAYLFQYSASLWIPFMLWIWMKQKIRFALLPGIVLGFIGLWLMMCGDKTLALFALSMGVACGFLQAFSVVAIQRLSKTEPILRILFYYFLLGAVVATPFAIPHLYAFSFRQWLGLFSVGIFTIASQYLLTKALSLAGADLLAPMSYTSIIFALLIAWFGWHEIPTMAALFGMALVILGCVGCVGGAYFKKYNYIKGEK